MSNSEAVCLKDVEEAAHKILPKKVLDYFKSGAEQQCTLRDNWQAFQRFPGCRKVADFLIVELRFRISQDHTFRRRQIARDRDPS